MTIAAPMMNGKHIMLAHGGGGQLTDELLADSVLPRLRNPALDPLLDSGLLANAPGHRIALTMDGYVVTPWRFPGGDIGVLAVSGTVNDLAVCGAKPIGIALGLIIAEGFARADLETVLDSIRRTADAAGVNIVTGDTKVVGRGAADGIYITTAGVGLAPESLDLSPTNVRPGDKLIVNGPVGEHGLAVMLTREMPEVQSVLTTDAAPLNKLIAAALGAAPGGIRFMRDPTRSGVAGVAADLATAGGYHVTLEEDAIPIRPEAHHAADMLGLDPLEIANEGKVILAVAPEAADAVLAALRADPLGRDAAVIGTIGDEADGLCEVHTAIGGRRILSKPYGEQLPRIC